MVAYIENVKILYQFEDSEKELTNADKMEIGRLILEGYTEGEIDSYCPEMEDSILGWWEIMD